MSQLASSVHPCPTDQHSKRHTRSILHQLGPAHQRFLSLSSSHLLPCRTNRDLSCPIIGAASRIMEQAMDGDVSLRAWHHKPPPRKGHRASISHTVRCAWHQKGRSERQSWKGQEPRRANPTVISSPVTGSPSHEWRRTAIRYLCRLHHTRQVVAHGGCAWRRMA